MLRNSFLFTILLLVPALVIPVGLLSFLELPLRLPLQITVITGAVILFFLITYRRIKPSLIIFRKTIKEIAEGDLTLDKRDMENIDSLSRPWMFDLKMIIRYSSLLLKNQSTILEAACNDRDFINKSKKLQDTIITINHSIVSTENTDVLLDEILKTAVNSIEGCEAGSVMIQDSRGKARYVAAIGMDLGELKKSRFKIEDAVVHGEEDSGRFKPVILRNKNAYMKKCFSAPTRRIMEKAGFLQYPVSLNAPIVIDDTIYGILSLEGKVQNTFTSEELRIMDYFTSEMAVVIKNSELIKKAIHLSRNDSLTNVHNRRFFEEIARMAIEEAARYNGHLHLVLFDLNDFKYVNDTYGHAWGDKVLMRFSELIQNYIRGSDIFARFGGDEFIALFRNSRMQDIRNKIDSLKTNFKNNPLKIEEREYNIKFSCGISGFPEDGMDLEALLKTADERMYKNKEHVKNGE